MIKKLIILFIIARKLALSDALKVISKFHQPPLIIKIGPLDHSVLFSTVLPNESRRVTIQTTKMQTTTRRTRADARGRGMEWNLSSNGRAREACAGPRRRSR